MASKPTEVTDFTCKICKRKLEYIRGEFVSYNISNRHFDYLISSYKYKGIIRELILNYKFEDKKYLVDFLSFKLCKLIKEYVSNNHIDYVLYVPISLFRFYERGYNQSFLLARKISRDIKIPLLKYGIIKIKHNKRQSELAHKDRFLNTKGVYKANTIYELNNKTVLLIDDIYTTGNTVNECSRVLKECGVKKVVVATVAIA